ncbi:MAG: hypothetical protein AAF846_19110 [Chloroflexota bacterium]
MVDKSKQAHAIRDYRVQKAFNFTLDDLSANQAGFMSVAQQWNLPTWMRGLTRRLSSNRLVTSRPKQVLHACGKLTIASQLRDIHGGRFQIKSHIISIAEANLRFSVSEEQSRALSDGAVYHLYYNPDTMQILSLERTATGC